MTTRKRMRIVDDTQALRNELSTLLARPVAAADLGEAIADRLPGLSAFRENDDLILVESGTRRLLVRRVAENRFRVTETAAASGSTNLLDAGGGAEERDLDGLVDEIMAFAGL
jgi:hypothetical protein